MSRIRLEGLSRVMAFNSVRTVTSTGHGLGLRNSQSLATGPRSNTAGGGKASAGIFGPETKKRGSPQRETPAVNPSS